MEAHRKCRSGDPFVPYEKLRQARRYLLLTRLDQLEMISAQHNRNSVDRVLSAVFSVQCHASTGEILQSNPICRCGYVLGERPFFTPIQEIEEAVDFGIMETAETLHAPAYQEKLLPYLKGLKEIGRKENASAIRRVLNINPERSEAFLSELDEALTPGVIQGINEAFRGRVVVVNRNLDELYGVLIHRKYTLPQIKKILREWLKEGQISEETFVHFVGQEKKEPPNSPDQK